MLVPTLSAFGIPFNKKGFRGLPTKDLGESFTTKSNYSRRLGKDQEGKFLDPVFSSKFLKKYILDFSSNTGILVVCVPLGSKVLSHPYSPTL